MIPCVAGTRLGQPAAAPFPQPTAPLGARALALLPRARLDPAPRRWLGRDARRELTPKYAIDLLALELGCEQTPTVAAARNVLHLALRSPFSLLLEGVSINRGTGQNILVYLTTVVAGLFEAQTAASETLDDQG